MAIYSKNSQFHQLDLSLLRHFFAIASFGGFSRASRATGISQPALSLGLKKLESALKVMLVKREGQTFLLTQEGLALFTFCQRFEASLSSTLDSFRTGDSGARRRLRIGTALSIGFGPFVSLCLQNSRLRNFMEIDMIAQNTFQLLNGLAEGTLDAALVPDDVYDNRLTLKKLWTDRVTFVVSKGHRGDYQSKSWKKDLTHLPLMTYPRETPMRALVDKICAENDLNFQIVYSANSVDALKLLVSRKAGGAFILRSLVSQGELKAHSLMEIKLPIELPKSGVTLATRTGEHGDLIAESIGAALSA